MMKLLYVIPLALAIAGCQSTTETLTSTQYKIVVPDSSMFNCPVMSKFPNAATLTDVQVAKTLVQLYKNNVTCKNSIEAIEQFLKNAQATIEKQ